MIGYVMVGTNNLNDAITFYDKVLQVIGLDRNETIEDDYACLLYTSPSPRDAIPSRMPSSA